MDFIFLLNGEVAQKRIRGHETGRYEILEKNAKQIVCLPLCYR